MTPAQYANAFRKLQVYFDAPPGDDDPLPPTPMALSENGRTPPILVRNPRIKVVDVNAYLLVTGGAPKQDYFGKFGPSLKHAAYIQARIRRIDGAIENLSVQYDEIAYALIAPFWGKGYPEECQLALQLWSRIGFGPPEISALLGKDGENGAVGLDCNGFVGGFLERSRNPTRWLRKTGSMTGAPINELMRINGETLDSLDDFAPPENGLMIMGLCDPADGRIKDYAESPPGHVVITEPGSARKLANGTVQITVSESTGKVGIWTSTYIIQSVAKATTTGAVFKVHRGSKEHKDTGNVTGYFKIRRLA
jgi:hypothetical protein